MPEEIMPGRVALAGEQQVARSGAAPRHDFGGLRDRAGDRFDGVIGDFELRIGGERLFMLPRDLRTAPVLIEIGEHLFAAQRLFDQPDPGDLPVEAALQRHAAPRDQPGEGFRLCRTAVGGGFDAVHKEGHPAAVPDDSQFKPVLERQSETAVGGFSLPDIAVGVKFGVAAADAQFQCAPAVGGIE